MLNLSKLTIIHLAHIFLIGGFLLYIGFYESKAHPWSFPLLIGVGIMVLAAHSYYIYKSGGKNINSWFHALLVAPLLIYVGWHGSKTDHEVFRLVMIAAFGAIGYHAYAIVRYGSV